MKSIQCELIAEPRQFKDEKTGQTRDYVGYSVKIGNVVVRITPNKTDRSLLEYVINNIK